MWSLALAGRGPPKGRKAPDGPHFSRSRTPHLQPFRASAHLLGQSDETACRHGAALRAATERRCTVGTAALPSCHFPSPSEFPEYTSCRSRAERFATTPLRRSYLHLRSPAGAHPPPLVTALTVSVCRVVLRLNQQREVLTSPAAQHCSQQPVHTQPRKGSLQPPRRSAACNLSPCNLASTWRQVGWPAHGPGLRHVAAARSAAAAAAVHTRQAAAEPAAGHKPHHIGGTQAQG